MAASKNPLKAVDFSSPNIKAQTIQAPKATSQNYATADWSSLGENLSDIGDSIANGISESKNAVEEVDKQKTNLEKRIDKADEKGKKDKVARLKGKLERRNIRKNSKKQMDDAEMIDKEKKAKAKAKVKVEAAKAKASEKTSKFNEKQREKGGSTTSHLIKQLDLPKPKGVYIDPAISTITAPVLQKLGSTGKGFKLRAFKNN